MAARTVLSAVFLLSCLHLCAAQIKWRFGPRYSRPCSRSCAGGLKRREVVCAAPNFAVYPDSMCIQSGPKPHHYVQCNRHDCPPSVQKGAWSPCQLCFRNRTLDCVVLGRDHYRRLQDPGLCNLTAASSVETGLCSSYQCPVSWQRFQCCDQRAGVACVLDDTGVEVQSWICDKFSHVLRLTYPSPNGCPDASCFNDTLQTSSNNQSTTTVLEEFPDATDDDVSTAYPDGNFTRKQTSAAARFHHSFSFLCLCIFLALIDHLM